jgi:hypothetical protein
VTVDLDRNGAIIRKTGKRAYKWPRSRASTPEWRAHHSDRALNWKTADAANISITKLGEVAAQGDGSVSPTKTTTYELTAFGPGGKATADVTVAVNRKLEASLSASQPEVRYHQVGDKVAEDGSTTVKWSTSGRGRQSPPTRQPDAARQAGQLAGYNRRVAIVLEPEGQPSAETYPVAADARILWARKEPSLKRMEEAAKTSVSVAEAHRSPVGR